MTEKEEIYKRVERIGKANLLLVHIASHGRHFFRDDADRPVEKEFYEYSVFTMNENNKLLFSNGLACRPVWMHSAPLDMRRELHSMGLGGTLTELVLALRGYIMTGNKLTHHLGPFPLWYSFGDPWGYKEDMKKVRDYAIELGIYEEK